MSFNTDQNMLFGILALQMDFIDREQLVTAMNGWVLDKKKPLEQVLLDEGFLDEEARALLAALVQKHVALHDGQPEKSLAAVSSIGSMRRQLEAIGDPDVEASLVRVSTACPVDDDDDDATASFSLGQSTSLGERFRILRPHAKGGLGQVSVARDTEVDREVAIKEIQDRYADDAHSRERFTQEAQITGGLEHPGIVPVYGLGQYGNGRPYYAMRFIRGDSLKEAIARFHEADQSGRDWGQRSLELRKLLGRFVDVCHALEYAHSRGVLHRDLKPGNIMLGKYGETLVVDWGLAKSVDRDLATRPSDEASLRPRSGTASAPTEMGAVMGTPAYMSPEQASGRLDLIGPATDVYGLGATLYCLLTGDVPFSSSEDGDTLHRVQEGRLVRPRELNSHVPKALDAICTKAMSLKQEDRYTSCQTLADEIERYLADEPVEAYREPLHVRLRRFVKHHQVGVTAAAVAVVVALVGASVLAIVVGAANSTIRDQNREIAAQNVELEATNQELGLARTEAIQRQAEAEEAQRRAEVAMGYIVESMGKLQNPSGIFTVTDMLDAAVAGLETALADEPSIQAQVLGDVGNAYRSLDCHDDAVKAHQRALEIIQLELGMEHPETLQAMHDLALSIGRTQPTRGVDLCQQILQLTDQNSDIDQVQVRDVTNSLGALYLGSGQADKAIQVLQDLLRVSEEADGPFHFRTVRTMHALGIAYREDRQLDKAIPLLEKVYQISSRRPDWLNSRSRADVAASLGDALRDAGRLDEAITLYEEAVQTEVILFGVSHSRTQRTQNRLLALRRAIASPEEGLSIQMVHVARLRLTAPTSEALAVAFTDLSLMYSQAKEYAKAEESARESLASYEAASSNDGKLLARIKYRLGLALRDQGKHEEAIQAFAESLDLHRQELGSNHADTLRSMRGLTFAYRGNGQRDKCVPLDEEIVRISAETLGADHSETLQAMDRLAMTHRTLGHDDKAIPLYDELLKLQREKAGIDNPDTQAWMEKCGTHYLVMRQTEKAKGLCLELLEFERRRDPSEPEKLAERLDTLAFCLLQQRKPAEAEPLLRESLEIRQSNPPKESWHLANTQSMLGEALIVAKNLSEAESLLLEAHKTFADPTQEIPNYFGQDLAKNSLTRLVKLYKALKRPDEAAKWQTQLDEQNAKPDEAVGKSEQ